MIVNAPRATESRFKTKQRTFFENTKHAKSAKKDWTWW